MNTEFCWGNSLGNRRKREKYKDGTEELVVRTD
jgi:hypothetical protein